MIVAVVIMAIYIICTSLVLLEMKRQHEDEVHWLRERISELEADKRSLTESLCRAEGKAFIPSRSEIRQRLEPPSDGWFDGKTEIRVKDEFQTHG